MRDSGSGAFAVGMLAQEGSGRTADGKVSVG